MKQNPGPKQERKRRRSRDGIDKRRNASNNRRASMQQRAARPATLVPPICIRFSEGPVDAFHIATAWAGLGFGVAFGAFAFHVLHYTVSDIYILEHFFLQALKSKKMGVQKGALCCDDEAGRRGLMCSKSPTSSVQSNCMLPPYHCRQLTANPRGPLVAGFYCRVVKRNRILELRDELRDSCHR